MTVNRFYTTKRAPLMSRSIAYWNKTAERYAKQPVANEQDYQKKIAITQSYLEPNMTVLEFGCGTGSTALIHAPKVKQYIGTDLAENMIEIANQKQRKSALSNLTFKTAQLNDFSPQTHAFDAVVGLNVLHLMADWKHAIAQVAALLKPGGVFITSTACLKEGINPYRFIAPFTQWVGLPLVKVFTRKELESTLERAGFTLDYRWVPEGNSLVYFLVAIKQ